MVYRVMSDGLARCRFGVVASQIPEVRRSVCKPAWDLNETSLESGYVYKTHDLPYGLPKQSPARIIFVFGSAVDTVLSVHGCQASYGSEWMEAHFRHLKAVGTIDEIFERDVLRIGEQVEAWTTTQSANVLCVRFERIWDNQSALSKFLGFPLRLPKRRARRASSASPHLRKRAEQIYGHLDESIARLPDIFVPENQYSSVLAGTTVL